MRVNSPKLTWLLCFLGLSISRRDLGAQSPSTDPWPAIEEASGKAQAGDLAGAIGVLEAAEKRLPSEPLIPSRLGVFYGMAGQYRRALDAHQRADSLAPDDPFNLAAWGLAFYALHDWLHAARLWERTKQLAPDYWATRKDLHALYYKAIAMIGSAGH